MKTFKMIGKQVETIEKKIGDVLEDVNIIKIKVNGKITLLTTLTFIANNISQIKEEQYTYTVDENKILIETQYFNISSTVDVNNINDKALYEYIHKELFYTP